MLISQKLSALHYRLSDGVVKMYATWEFIFEDRAH